MYAAEALLDLGANPLAEDCNCRTPLHFAAEGSHAACVRLLVSRICHTGSRAHSHPSTARNNTSSNTNNQRAPPSAGSSESGYQHEEDVLTDSDEGYDEEDDSGYAADGDATTTTNTTAAATPTTQQQRQSGKASTNNTASTAIVPKESTALATTTNTTATKENRDSINKPDHNGQTPLQLASRAGAMECVAALLDVDGSAEGKRLSALHLAVKQGLTDVAHNLLSSRR